MLAGKRLKRSHSSSASSSQDESLRQIAFVLVSTLVTAGWPQYESRSCAELVALRVATEAGATRLAEWMERHCPGALEDTQPFCRLQSDLLLERLDELGEVKAALDAKHCEPGR